MTITVSKQEFCSRITELLSLVEGGAEVLIQDGKKPPLQLIPAPPPKRPFIFNMHPGAWVMREDFDDPIDEEAFLRGDF